MACTLGIRTIFGLVRQLESEEPARQATGLHLLTLLAREDWRDLLFGTPPHRIHLGRADLERPAAVAELRRLSAGSEPPVVDAVDALLLKLTPAASRQE